MDISRRKFLGATASAVIVAGTMTKGRVFGANDRIRVCVMGFNGRGKNHLEAYNKLDGVEVATLCDVDSALFKPTIEKFFKGKPEPKTETDIRKVLEDKDIDAVSMATPNHWHSLGAIWACQAGKDVYVEKPMSHNVFEGRKLVEAAEKYKRIVQHGTQLRSNPGFQEGIQQLKKGVIGDVYMARCVCYKWRPDIGKAKPGTPPATLDWNIWQGPAQEKPFMVKENDDTKGIFVPYYWHWVWDYGNGDIGNQGVHQLDAARWGLGVTTPYRVASMGGMFLWDDAKEVFNVSSSSFMFKGQDGKDKMMTLEVRPWCSNEEEGGSSFGVLFYGSEGYMTFPDYGSYKVFLGKDRKLAKEGNDGSDVNHFKNFLDCVRSRDAGKVSAPPIEGHYSSALSHYALAAARVNRVLEIDTDAEKVKNDDEANKLLTREYRKGFEVPQEV
jgi:predicted dehydrogenase